jgi:hypothetical protein
MRTQLAALGLAGAILGLTACGPATEQGSGNSAPQPPSTSAPSTTTTDPKAADIAAIKTMYHAQNDAWNNSVDDGLETEAATSYPPGQVTKSNILCGFQGDLPGSTGLLSEADMLYLLQIDKERRTNIPDESTIEAQPGWVPPSNRFLTGGKVPDGRIYVYTLEQSTAERDSAPVSYKSQVHATVIDGKAYDFPRAC